ncbi:MAG: hypothetical protein GY832_14545 [Chloroflexi bacterium]|nr:hypothetical protein [Chloroflexota bacterium]
MMRSKRFLLIVVVLTATLFSGASATYAQPPSNDCRYFAETGYYVCDAFLGFFDARGGLEIYGNPITEAFNDPILGLRVQFFQNVRMEFHPYNPFPYQVQLGLLVDELGYRFPPARSDKIPTFNTNLRHYFPETRHVVEYSFLEHFRENGGIDTFGYPRSEFMYEDGRIVQYFQRARMEWHPEITSGSQMRLTSLGEIYVERFGIPDVSDEPVPPQIGVPTPVPPPPTATPPSTVTKLNVSASVRYVITGREGGQTVFVYVTDQLQQSVPGASVRMVVQYPSGDQFYEFEELTNDSGFTGFYFDILPASPGQKVVIAVAVTYKSLTGTTQTFFLPWW